MDMLSHDDHHARSGQTATFAAEVVNDDFPYQAFSRSQLDLLELLPFPGATIGLDEALHIVSHDHAQPYGQIIVLMNRGIIESFFDGDIADPDIVLRRL